MAVTFSYDDDSVAAIDKFLSAHNNPAYAPVLYSRLGDLYVEKERFQDAAAVYRAFATREPNSEFSPGLSMQAIEAYRKGGFTAARARRQARIRRAVQLRHARSGRAATRPTTRTSPRS